MHKHLLFLLTLFIGSNALMAEATKGNTYRLVPVKATDKSLMTQNSSLDEKATVVLWDETDVPSQQWTLAGTLPAAVTFRNSHSQLVLGTSGTTAGTGRYTRICYCKSFRADLKMQCRS